ncbi:probable palmitoyltransferase ZDHHC11 [Limulus polyphemus]|uniref:Probable palmitoyltransferase ZDHHC11 n=1 Tax=Limulus polyphemus TaxID=6850 RepID=A0ABM1S1Y7_LIMPO|nr:probable palmitoyltransferase ZDHHC11 [Limulus polyphemus]
MFLSILQELIFKNKPARCHMKSDFESPRTNNVILPCWMAVHICCKSQGDSSTWSRKNGWSLPLHPLQVLAWFFLLLFAVLYFGVLVSSIPCGLWQIMAYVVLSVVYVIHIVIHVIGVSLDPADPNVLAKNVSGPCLAFDRSTHTHVIENQLCYICGVKV